MGLPRRAASASGRFAGARRVHGSRSISALYGTLSVVLLVAALVMALIVRPPPPPPIAELGPSPQEQIEEARENQAAGSGSADIVAAAEEEQARTSKQQEGSTTTIAAPSTTTSAKKVPSTRRCFGDPPRQTEDPHSPPCVFELFQGDNRGSTAVGVTGTEIKIVIRGDRVTTESQMEALLAHFNQRYEFFGRNLVAVAYPDQTNDTGPSESAAAAEDDASHEPFAVVSPFNHASSAPYYSKLVEKKINVVATRPTHFGRSAVGEGSDGLFWSTFQTLDRLEYVAGEFVCEILNGNLARHAGEDRLKKANRKFAILSVSMYEYWPPLGSLRENLQRCGAEFRVFEIRHERNIELMQELSAKGFTTVAQVGDFYNFGVLVDASTVQYFPEWLSLGLRGENEQTWANREWEEQARHAFGISPQIKVRAVDEVPACWAIEANGESCASQISYFSFVEELYKGLLVLASGIQGAGPKLTPEAFRRALWETVWPNPHASRPPYWQQRVGFSPGDPIFYDDYALWSWDESIPSQETPVGPASNPDHRGSFCYLDRGSRFVSGDEGFPSDADQRFFREKPCR